MPPKLTQTIALAACVALGLAASWLTPRINAGRAALDTYRTEQLLENTPPEYAFAIQAFGAFRGLLTNIAFIRAEEFKNQGRYYDAMQLASWICKLQPRFPSVWEFQSWNMAWNISITTYTPEERWNWIYNGLRLIRDEGLRYNPRAINLYKQLAWIFVNKISDTTDQFHLFFKRAWAWRMHLVLGPPPDPLGDYRPGEQFEAIDFEIGDDPLSKSTLMAARARVDRLRERLKERDYWEYDRQTLAAAEELLKLLEGKQDGESDEPETTETLRVSPGEVAKTAAYARLHAIAEAPDTLAELYEQFPATREMVAKLAEIGAVITDEPLVEDEYWNQRDGLAFQFFYRYRRLVDPPALMRELQANPEPDPDEQNRKRLGEILKVADYDPAGVALVRFLQKKTLHDVYKMDAAKMAELTALFGPMDWRMVDAHSLYWVNEGLIAGRETISKFGNDKTNTARIIFFSLRNLMNKNRMVFEPYTTDVNYAYINFNPDLNFIEPMHQAFLNYGRMIDPEPEAKGVGATYRTSHINFLAEAIRLLYLAGRTTEAGRYYQYLRDTYGTRVDGSRDPTYAISLRDYVDRQIREGAGGYRDERLRIYGMLMRAWESLGQGDRTQGNTFLAEAARAHRVYNAEVGEEEVLKMKLPTFREMENDTLVEWYREPSVSNFAVVEKARLWRNLPMALRRPVYDRLSQGFQQECAAFGFDLSRTYPEPEGMDAYRAEFGGRAEERPDDFAETPAQND